MALEGTMLRRRSSMRSTPTSRAAASKAKREAALKEAAGFVPGPLPANAAALAGTYASPILGEATVSLVNGNLQMKLLMASFFAWHRATGSLQLGSVSGGKSEFFYWLTIMCSQTLGTALGDWTADSLGLGYAGGALVFGTLLLALWLLYRWTTLPRIALFWAAFVLTRPLGAVLGDLLDKPVDHGGLALSRYAASLALLAAMAGMVLLVRQRPARSLAHG